MCQLGTLLNAKDSVSYLGCVLSGAAQKVISKVNQRETLTLDFNILPQERSSQKPQLLGNTEKPKDCNNTFC